MGAVGGLLHRAFEGWFQRGLDGGDRYLGRYLRVQGVGGADVAVVDRRRFMRLPCVFETRLVATGVEIVGPGVGRDRNGLVVDGCYFGNGSTTRYRGMRVDDGRLAGISEMSAGDV